MKKIKIKFMGFWPEFDESNNFIINLLKKNYEVILSDNPDYIISSCFSNDYLKYENCVRIFYTGENLCPDFNAHDYAIGFEYLSFGDRYIRYSNYLIPEERGVYYNLMLKKHEITKEELNSKSEFCSFVVSKGDGYVSKTREIFFKELSKYKRVNSGGRFLNNIGEPNGVKDKLDFQLKHKFCIAFENSSHDGYTTEKIVEAFAAKTVPIYWGDPLITKVFNKDSFVNCMDFDSFDEVVNYVKEIDSDDDLYEKMLKTPAMIEYKTLEDENLLLENFLYNIFDQKKESAFRRDTVGYGKKHCDLLVRLNGSLNSKIILFNIIKKIVKTIRIRIKCI